MHVEVDAVEIIGREVAHRFVQFGGQFDPGGAGADDGAMQLTRPQRLVLRVGAQAGVDHAPVESRGLVERIERDGMIGDARRAEIIGHAAHGDDQRIVAKHARRNDSPPVLVVARRDIDLLLGAVQSDHLADAIAIMAAARMGHQFERVGFAVHCAGGDFVQQRLPDVNTQPVEQRDRGLAAAAERRPKQRRQMQPRRAAADNEDAMQRGILRRYGFRNVVEG